MGPLVAGIVYDHAGYYAVFGIVFGVLGFDLLLRAFLIESREASKWLSDQKTTSAVPEGQDREEAGNTSEGRGNCRAHHRSSEVGHDYERQRSQEANEQTSLLSHNSRNSASWFYRTVPKTAILGSSPRLMAATYGCLTDTILFACIDTILPRFVQRTFHWTSSGAGSIFLTITCPSLFGPFFGALSDRYGPRPVCLAGLALTTLNLGLMGLVRENALLDKILLCVFLVLIGKVNLI